MKGNKIKLMGFTFCGLFVLTGIYNSVVINSKSLLDSDVKFVKRLDEVYGVTIPGRKVAAATTWKKISSARINTAPNFPKKIEISNISDSAPVASSSSEVVQEAVIQENLNLNLIEVINPKRWQNGLKQSEFTGSISTNNGVIESLSVSLPGDEGLSVSFSEMTGNVFEYDFNGELYSGMMYQVDQSAYIVTLTNGPLEGTQLRFSSQASPEEQQQEEQFLAENNVNVGEFGSENIQAEISPEAIVEEDQKMQEEAAHAQSYNFDQPQGI